ncbi:MAG: hypothetical protein ABL951_04165 [Alphaproteobacteria bacterium]
MGFNPNRPEYDENGKIVPPPPPPAPDAPDAEKDSVINGLPDPVFYVGSALILMIAAWFLFRKRKPKT